MNIPTLAPLPPIAPDKPWLAPLAGFSDLPFRLLCKEHGAAVTCTEMVSAKGLVYGLKAKISQAVSQLSAESIHSNSGTEDLLTTTVEDTPLVVQLFGAEAEFMAKATEVLVQRGFTAFDINMGCSVPKVTKTGAGAAMLKDINNAAVVTKAVVQAAGTRPVGVKIRLGWHTGEPVYLDLTKQLEDAGAAWITLHPRYARQGFSGNVERDALRVLCQTVQIPVMASGDLFSAQDAVDCINETGVDGIMFARGALANPMIFDEFLHLLGQRPYTATADKLRLLILRHAELARIYTPGKPGKKGYTPALLKMRTFVPRYLKHFPNIRQLRQSLAACESWEELNHIVAVYFSSLEDQGQPLFTGVSHAGHPS